MDDFLLSIEQILKGFHLAEKYVSSDQTVHYFIQKMHIGDTTRHLAILKPFREYYSGVDEYHFTEKERVNSKLFPKKRIVKKIVVMTTQILSGVARLFEDVDDVIVFTQDELKCLDLYATSSACVHPNLYYDENDNWIREIMFGVSTINWQLFLPKGELSNGHGVISSKVKEKIDFIVNRDKINPTKTLVLCPYAQSSSSIDVSVWDSIINFYKSLNFDVFCNVGPNEKELINTKRLQLPIDEFCGLIDRGCTVFGLQSGLIDTLRWIKIKSKMYILFNIIGPHETQFAINRGVALDKPITENNNVTYFCFQNTSSEVMSEVIQNKLKEDYND